MVKRLLTIPMIVCFIVGLSRQNILQYRPPLLLFEPEQRNGPTELVTDNFTVFTDSLRYLDEP